MRKITRSETSIKHRKQILDDLEILGKITIGETDRARFDETVNLVKSSSSYQLGKTIKDVANMQHRNDRVYPIRDKAEMIVLVSIAAKDFRPLLDHLGYIGYDDPSCTHYRYPLIRRVAETVGLQRGPIEAMMQLPLQERFCQEDGKLLGTHRPFSRFFDRGSAVLTLCLDASRDRKYLRTAEAMAGSSIKADTRLIFQLE
jgi:hypothetical protein